MEDARVFTNTQTKTLAASIDKIRQNKDFTKQIKKECKNHSELLFKEGCADPDNLVVLLAEKVSEVSVTLMEAVYIYTQFKEL